MPNPTNPMRMWVLLDDGISIQVHHLPEDVIEAVAKLDPPRPPQLLSPHMLGLVQRIREGVVVSSPADDEVLYPHHELGRAICSALGLV